MARLPQPFNAYLVDPQFAAGQLPVCPEGLPVIISSNEYKTVKDKPNCYYVELTLTVVDGPHKGETGPFRLNLGSDNETASRIAYQQLSAICHVTGQMNVSDVDQLQNIPFKISVHSKTYKNNNNEDVQGSEVKGILDINGNKPKPASAGQAQNGGTPQFAQPQNATPVPQQPQTQQAPPWANSVAQPGQTVPAGPPSQPAGNQPPWAR